MITKMIHFLPTGQITHLGEGSLDFIENLFTEPVDRDVDPKTEYWLSPNVVPRPACPITLNKLTCLANASDEIIMENVAGKFFLDEVEYPLTDSTVYLTFAEVGSHVITVKNFPMQDFRVTIHAN